jgi:hypothetical protein
LVKRLKELKSESGTREATREFLAFIARVADPGCGSDDRLATVSHPV